MNKYFVIVLGVTLVFATSSFARESTEELANRLLQGQKAFEMSKQTRDSNIRRILSDATLDPKDQQKVIRNLQEGFLKNSRAIHLKYREPFVQRVIAETNAKLPNKQKITKGLGSDIYLRDKKTGKVVRDAKGRKVVNPKHRGWQGDLDLGGNPRAAEELNTSFKKYGVHLSSDMMDAPGYKDFKEVEVTINVEGRMDKPGSSTHLTQTQMDAFSKETYVSVGMKKNQAGKKLVETNDHIKKAIKGFNTDAAHLVSTKGEDVLQGMGKGTLKSMDSGGVNRSQLNSILDKAGYKGGTKNFKRQLNHIKGGHLASGVGLDKKNAKAFQTACKGVTEQAVKNASKAAAEEIANKKREIARLEKMVTSSGTSNDLVKKHKNKIKDLQEDLADSKIKMEQSAFANQEKLKGGDYNTFYERNLGKPGKKSVSILHKPTTPKTSRVGAIKKGLKPGILDIAGYGMSAYSIYDTRQRYLRGEMTKNEATIETAGEVVDTGFGVVTDVGTAAVATGAAVTGSVGIVAMIAGPLVVTAVATHYVTAATKEGLKLVAAYKNEKISTKIADAKIQEAVNTFNIEVNNLMKLGVMTGDWRYFSQADDIIAKLENMYTVTKDETLYRATNDLFDQVDSVKDFLEKNYGGSIYAMKEKVENARGEEQEKAMAKAGWGKIGFGKIITQNIHSGHGKVGDTFSFRVDRHGNWNEKHTVEWLVNGETFKSFPANNEKVNSLIMSSGYLDPGQYTVAVRIIDAATGKIVTHTSTKFILQGAEAVAAFSANQETTKPLNRPKTAPSFIQDGGQKTKVDDGNRSNSKAGKKKVKKPVKSLCSDWPLIKNRGKQWANEMIQLKKEVTPLNKKIQHYSETYAKEGKRVKGWVTLYKSDTAQLQAGTMSKETHRRNWIENGKLAEVRKGIQGLEKLRGITNQLIAKSETIRLRSNKIGKTIEQINMLNRKGDCAALKAIISGAPVNIGSAKSNPQPTGQQERATVKRDHNCMGETEACIKKNRCMSLQGNKKTVNEFKRCVNDCGELRVSCLQRLCPNGWKPGGRAGDKAAWCYVN